VKGLTQAQGSLIFKRCNLLWQQKLTYPSNYFFLIKFTPN
jgi:hypothetical protein